MLNVIVRVTAVLVVALVLVAAVMYFSDMNRAYARVTGKSSVLSSPFGDVEYTENGAGPDVLVVHGAGGGFDQGELLGQALLGNQFHVITPSRFGYLRSTFQPGATYDQQADAFAFLLDHLGIDRVAVVAFSAGGPSAELLALRHPERVSSLTLISCATTTLPPSNETAQASRQGDMLMQIVKYDLPYWVITRVFESRFMGLMGAPDNVVTGLTPEQRALARSAVEYMNPASLRAAGAVFDNQTPSVPGTRLTEIGPPTLIVHAADDTLQPYYHAAFASSTIPGAQLLRFEQGGHLVFATELPKIRAAVQKHILDHAGQSEATSAELEISP
jgi:pimeloyl-ACP methyl ester carboxylesterase